MSRVRIESVDALASVMESVMEPESMAEEDNIISPTITSPGISIESEKRRSVRNRNSIEKYVNEVQNPNDLPQEHQHLSYPELTTLYDDEDILMKAKNANKSHARNLTKIGLYDTDLDGFSRNRIESVDTLASVMESVMEPESMAEEDNIIRPTITSPGISIESENRRSIRTRNSIEKYFNEVQNPNDLPHEHQHTSYPELTTSYDDESYPELTTSYDDEDILMKKKNAYNSYARNLTKVGLDDSVLDGFPERTKSNLSSLPSGYYRNGKSIDLQLRNTFRQGSSGTHAEKYRPSWKDVPVLAVTATPVTQEDNTFESLEKICKETKNNSRIIRVLIFLVLILIGVASIAAYLSLKDDDSGVDISSQELEEMDGSNGSGSTEFPSQIVTAIPTPGPSPLPTPEPSSPPTPARSLRPSISLSNKPTSFPTQIPTITPTHGPTPTSSSPPSIFPSGKPSSQNCANWCTSHSLPWSSKCKWTLTCGHCPECEFLSSAPFPSPTSAIPTQNTCKNWCYTNETPWYNPDPLVKQKCRYPQNCAGCVECSDPDIFPPAGN